jgi:hypothetical protein
MAPLNHVSDSNLVATVAAAISVLGHHTHTAGKFPRREFGAAYLQATEDARSGQRRDMAGPELETLFHTLKYRGLCFPSAFTTIDGETERTTSGDILALFRMGHGSTFGVLFYSLHIDLTCMCA